MHGDECVDMNIIFQGTTKQVPRYRTCVLTIDGGRGALRREVGAHRVARVGALRVHGRKAIAGRVIARRGRLLVAERLGVGRRVGHARQALLREVYVLGGQVLVRHGGGLCGSQFGGG